MTWFTVLGGLAGATVLGLLALALEVRRLRRREAVRTEELRGLRDDMSALCAGAVGLGERQARLELQLRHLRERQEEFELQEPDSRPYAQAINLVHKGATAEEIVSTCGLTQAEANLIVMLHGMDKVS